MAIAKVRAATEELRLADRTMRKHIDRVGACELKPRSGGLTHFEQLSRNIVFQQLAGKAAATIWRRTHALAGGTFDASTVKRLSDEQLRGAGLSNNKLLSLRDLTQHVLDGRLPLDRIARQRDEVVIDELTQVRGIGRWTAQMFLMFQLGRLDVWPVGDLGVRNGYRLIYKLDEMPTPEELDVFGEKFQPWRSIAAWYCWRATDTPTVTP